MNASHESLSLTLQHRQLVDLTTAEPYQLQCDAGTLWITGEHARGDNILLPGDSLHVSARDRLLVQALGPSALRWIASAAGSPTGNRRLAIGHPPSRLLAPLIRSLAGARTAQSGLVLGH